MSEIVPFVSQEAQRAAEQTKKLMEDLTNPPQDDAVAAIEQILKSMEGMQEQIAAMTDLILALDARLDKLEGKKKLISTRN